MLRSIALLGMLLLWGSQASGRPPDNAARVSTSVKAGDPALAARLGAAFGAVTSIHRSPAHNRAVGGVPNSYHVQGRAIDIARRPGVSHGQVAAVLRAAGYNLIESLDEGDHSHFAFGPVADPRGPRALQASAVARKSAPGAVQAAVAQPPSVKQLAADNHGTLLLDLPPSASKHAAAAPRESMEASR